MKGDGVCKNTHNLTDNKCVSMENALGQKIGNICKKKCSVGTEYKCRGNQMNRMKCDKMINHVCESAEPPCFRRPPQDFPAARSISDFKTCGKSKL